MPTRHILSFRAEQADAKSLCPHNLSFRAEWADAFSFTFAPANVSAHAARNLFSISTLRSDYGEVPSIQFVIAASTRSSFPTKK